MSKTTEVLPLLHELVQVETKLKKDTDYRDSLLRRVLDRAELKNVPTFANTDDLVKYVVSKLS